MKSHYIKKDISNYDATHIKLLFCSYTFYAYPVMLLEWLFDRLDCYRLASRDLRALWRSGRRGSGSQKQ